jgi:hypothetical protein
MKGESNRIAEFADSFKMVSARVLQQKELGADLGISEADMAGAEKALTKYNISIRESNGGLRNLDDILKDTSVAFSTMSDSDKQYVANKLAGVRQTSSFIAMMDSMKVQQDLYGKALASTGALEDANSIKAESYQGKLNTLKTTFNQLSATMINGKMLTGGLDIASGSLNGINTVASKLGTFPTLIMAITGALTIFNTKFRENVNIIGGVIPGYSKLTNSLNGLKESLSAQAIKQAENISTLKTFEMAYQSGGVSVKGMSTQLAGMEAKLVATRLAMVATTIATVAMETAVSMGLSLAVSFAITKIMDLVNAQENLKKSNEEVISSYKSEKESITNATNLLKQKTDLENKISQTNEGTKENKDLKEKLLDIERQLATALPNSVTGFDSEGKAISSNNKQIEEQIRLKKESMLADTMKQLGKNNSAIDLTLGYNNGDLSNIQNTLETLKKTKAEFESQLESATTNFEKWQAKTGIESYSKMITDAESRIASNRSLVLQAVDAGKSYQQIADEMGVSEDVVKSYGKAVQDNTEKQKQNSNQIKEASNQTKILAQANKELSSGSNLSTDTISKIAEIYPEVGDNAEKATAKVDEFNNSVKEAQAKEVEDATTAYTKSAEEIAKAQGFLDKLNKSQAVTPALVGEVLKVYPELATSLGSVTSLQEGLNSKIKEQQVSQNEAYLTMMSDDETFYQNKIANNDEYKNAYNNLLNAFVADGEQAYTIDFSKYKTLNELKQGTMNSFGTSVNKWLSQYVDVNADGYAVDLSNFTDIAKAKVAVLAKLNEEIKKINANLAGTEAMKSVFDNTNQRLEWQGDTDLPQSDADKFLQKSNDDVISKYKTKIDQLNGAVKEVDTKFDGFGTSMKGFSGGDLGGASDFSGTGEDSGKKGKSAETLAKEAEAELVKSEKQMLTDITDAYNQAKDKIDDDINAIDTSLQLLGDADDSNFTQRVDLATQKIAKQKDEVTNASDQLQKLKDTTVTTAEAQKELESATLKASKELRTQTLEASKLQKELEKTTQEEIKATLEKQKEIDTETLDAQQKAQTDRLDAIKTKQETLHQEKLDALDSETKALEAQSTALDEQNTATERATELEKEKTDLLEKQQELTNLESQKTNQVYQKQADGSWNFMYVSDKEAVSSKQKEVDTAQATLDETNRKNALDDAKKEIEDQKSVIEAEKTSEDTAYDKKKSYLDKYSDDLKESQERDKQRLETHYADIDTLSKETLKQLETEYNNNWDAIAEHITTTLTATKKQLEDLTTLKANFTTTEADEAINSGDVSGYINKNKSKMTDEAKVDENEINTNLKNIDTSAKVANTSIDDLTQSYKDLLSVKNNNEITNEDITTRKSQVKTITNIDSEGLNTSLKNLQDTDKKLEIEQDTHCKTELTRQSKAQDDELASLKKFSESYLLVTNKFLELLQVVYDFRFNNITTIVSGAVSNILEALIQTEADYEKFAEMWNKMHKEDDQIPSSVDISSNVSGTASYKQSTTDYQTGKLSLYSADAFEKYASQIGNGISESLLSKLSNYSASVGVSTSTSNSSTVNNKSNSSSSSTTNVNISQLDVNTKDAQTLLNQLLIIVQNKTNLS